MNPIGKNMEPGILFSPAEDRWEGAVDGRLSLQQSQNRFKSYVKWGIAENQVFTELYASDWSVDEKKIVITA